MDRRPFILTPYFTLDLYSTRNFEWNHPAFPSTHQKIQSFFIKNTVFTLLFLRVWCVSLRKCWKSIVSKNRTFNLFFFDLFQKQGVMSKSNGSLRDKKPVWKQAIRPAIYITIGIIIAFPIFSITYYTMVRTTTPQFCAMCHEIQFAYNTWKTSTHANNAQGFVADCMDCHLPAPHDTFDFFYAKTWHGIKDLFTHVFLLDEYDHEKNRQKAYASFENDQCQKCHRNVLHIPDKRGAMLAHRSVLFARPGYEKKCVDCHKNLVHRATPVYRYKQYEETYRGLGL